MGTRVPGEMATLCERLVAALVITDKGLFAGADATMAVKGGAFGKGLVAALVFTDEEAGSLVRKPVLNAGSIQLERLAAAFAVAKEGLLIPVVLHV